MKRIIVASDNFTAPGARSAARSMEKALRTLVDVMDRHEDNLESLLDDPNFYDAAVAELKRLDGMLNN